MEQKIENPYWVTYIFSCDNTVGNPSKDTQSKKTHLRRRCILGQGQAVIVKN